MRIKHICLMVISILCFVPRGIAANNSIVANSGQIQAVTVYAKDAKVIRSISIANELLVDGFNNIVIEDVSGSADIGSLQLSCAGKLNAAVEEVSHSSYQKIESLEIDNQIQEIDSKVSEIQDALNTIDSKIRIFDNFNFSLSDNASTEVLEKQLNSVSSIVNEILIQKNELLLNLAGLKEIKVNLLKQKEDFLSANKRFKLNVNVMVEKNSTDSLELVLVYNEKNAGWSMSYDVRVLPESDKIEIISNANIWQSTSENWEDVELSISSTLNDSFWVGNVSDKGSVPNNGLIKGHIVNSSSYATELFYSADFSSAVSGVFFVAQFLNSGDMPYIPGPAHIFYGGAYKGYISFPETNIQSVAVIKIEKASGILINKRLVKEDFIKEGILKIEKKLVSEYEIFFKSIIENLEYNKIEIADSFLGENMFNQNTSIVDVLPLPYRINEVVGKVTWKEDLTKEAKIIKYKTISIVEDNK